MSNLFCNPLFLLSRRSCLLLCVILVVSACSKDAPPPSTAAAPAQADQSAARAIAQRQAALISLPLDELKKRGSQALHEQRLYAPSGDNAIEYYLTLRNKSVKSNATVEKNVAENALIDLLPYAVIAAEQAINRKDFVEAERLRVLIERTDSQAPALSRIAGLIAKGKAESEQAAATDAARAEQLAKAAEAAKLKAAQQAEVARLTSTPSTPTPVTATPIETVASTRTSSSPSTTNTSVSTTPVVTAPTTTASSEPTAAASAPTSVVKAPPVEQPTPPTPTRSALVPINTPQPDYPPEAQRTGKTGTVVASFTVNTDGSVGNISIVSSKPRGVFDRNVQSAVRRWKFQPIDKAQTVTRTFNFTL